MFLVKLVIIIIIQSHELLLYKIFFAYVLHRGMLFHIFCKLNSSPIDELREGGYENGWWCQAKCEPNEQGTQVSSQPPREQKPTPGTITLRNSVEILTNLYIYSPMPTKKEGKGSGKPLHKNKIWSSKQLPRASMCQTEAWQKPVCQIGVHDLRIHPLPALAQF